MKLHWNKTQPLNDNTDKFRKKYKDIDWGVPFGVDISNDRPNQIPHEYQYEKVLHTTS